MVAIRVIRSAGCVAFLLWAVGSCSTDVACTNCRAADGLSPDAPTSTVEPDAPPEPEPQPAAEQEPEPEPEEEPEPSPSPEPNVEPYGNCLEETRVCQHGEAPRCLVDDADDVTMAFCTSSCVSAQECPRAPLGSEAQQNCLTLSPDGACVLDCFGGQTCPQGMVCLPFGVCGYVNEAAENPYDRCGDCPGDWCLSFNTGEVCLPPCSGSDCPSARNGESVPRCLEVEGRYGCAIECDVPFACPDGMFCERVGSRSLCLWPHDDPCAALDCGRDADCQLVQGRPDCVCEPGLVETPLGDCVHPCATIDCHATAYCDSDGMQATCVCAPGQTMDAEGACEQPEQPDTDPCDPNPCQPPVSSCVEVDGTAFCDCQDPTTTPPDCAPEPECVTHFDGDAFEPNDCFEDATLIGAAPANLGTNRLEADFGPELDDIDLFRLTPQAGAYWVLLEAAAPVCELDLVPLPADAAFGGFSYGRQVRADETGQPFECSYDLELGDSAAYALGILYFPFLADLPPYYEPDVEGQGPMGPVYLEVMDRFDGDDDVDAFSLPAELPVSLGFTGQRSSVSIEVIDEFGQAAPPIETECAFTLDPIDCIELPGTGLVTLVISVARSPSAEQTELDAWRVGLIRPETSPSP